MSESIKQQLIQLAPWHMDIALPNGLRTSIGNQDEYQNPDFSEVSVIRTDALKHQIQTMYPDGLYGRSFLDVGCNSGGYCFMANELGAEFAYGFDVREHWIKQAKFVAQQKAIGANQVDFQTHHIEDLPRNRKFDITIFKGVFYHLPDPIDAIKLLSDITTETIVLDTGTRSDIPEDCLMATFESTTHVMSGVDKLCWYPGGPGVLRKLLNWAGFEYFRTISWVLDNRPTESRKSAKKLTNHGRICVVASRIKEPVERMIDSLQKAA